MVNERPALALVSAMPLMRDGLRRLLQEQVPALELRYIGSSITDALLVTSDACSGVFIIDPQLGYETPPAQNVAHARTSRLPVLVVSGSDDQWTVRSCLRAGARAYVTYRTEPRELIGLVRNLANVDSRPQPAEQSSDPQFLDRLSTQEQRALALYASGMTLTQVAASMKVTPHTAKEYLDRVRRKSASAGVPARTKVELHQMARAVGLM